MLTENEVKKDWNKKNVIEYKNDRVAMIQRKWGEQIEFIQAFDKLTAEGYVLRTNESYSGKFSGRNITYFYFQKMPST